MMLVIEISEIDVQYIEFMILICRFLISIFYISRNVRPLECFTSQENYVYIELAVPVHVLIM